MEISGTIEWNDSLEKLISADGEKALCSAWLHNKAEALYSSRNNFIALPVIIASTLAGTASIGSGSLFGDQSYAQVGIGIVSISVAMLNTIGQYFAFAKKAEGHRVAHISYQKLYRFVAVEMSLPRKERMKACDLLKVVRESVDRLAETSPLIPNSIIAKFKDRFDKSYADVAKPEICNGLSKITVVTGSPISSPLRVAINLESKPAEPV